MEGSIRSATFQALQQGYEAVFKPARKDKNLGRAKGGLAILSRIGTPMLRATEGPQAELGRWMHAVIQVRPGECLHTINLYGCWTGRRTYEFPIDVAQGSGLHRPLARPGATAPQGSRRLDWFLASSGLLPSTGWEELTAFKPDHTAVAIELDVQFRAPQYQGIKKNPEANVEQAHLRFWIEPAAWQAALEQQDVEELWELWNNAAVAALEVRPQGRGVLCLEKKTLKPPKEDKFRVCARSA
eukprot:5270211-Amphidinium_carterae.1